MSTHDLHVKIQTRKHKRTKAQGSGKLYLFILQLTERVKIVLQ